MSTTDLEILPPPTPERQAKAKKATGVAVFGTFIEYYDFSVYGYVAATLAMVFFPSDNPTIGPAQHAAGVRRRRSWSARWARSSSAGSATGRAGGPA